MLKFGDSEFRIRTHLLLEETLGTVVEIFHFFEIDPVVDFEVPLPAGRFFEALATPSLHSGEIYIAFRRARNGV